MSGKEMVIIFEQVTKEYGHTDIAMIIFNVLVGVMEGQEDENNTL